MSEYVSDRISLGGGSPTRRKSDSHSRSASCSCATTVHNLCFRSGAPRASSMRVQSFHDLITCPPPNGPTAQDLSVKRQDNTLFFLWFYGVLYMVLWCSPWSSPTQFRDVSQMLSTFLGVEQPSLTIKMKLGMIYPPSVMHDCSAFASTHAAYLFLPHFQQLLEENVCPFQPSSTSPKTTCLPGVGTCRVSLASTHPQKIWVRLNHPKYRWKVSMSGKFDKNFI